MALQLRRGTNAQRLQLVLKEGELVFVTDFTAAGVGPLWIGNGQTAGGVAPTAITALRDLTDVTLTNPVANQLLNYNGSKWVNASNITIPGTLGVSGTSTLNTLTAGATTLSSLGVSGSSLLNSLTVGATTIGSAGSPQNLTVWGTSYLGNASASGTLTVTGATTLNGDLTINGTTTTINATTLTVDDKNIELGSVATPTDTTATGGGITLRGATNKELFWSNANNSWNSSENISLYAGKAFAINSSNVISGVGLGAIKLAEQATQVNIGANGNTKIGINTTTPAYALDVVGNSSFWNNLIVNGSGTAGTGLTVGGNTQLNGTLTSGNTTHNGTLGVISATTLGSTLNVSGATTIGSAGNPQNLTAYGTTALNILTAGATTLGNTSINSNLTVSNSATINGNLTVTSAISGGTSVSAYYANYNGLTLGNQQYDYQGNYLPAGNGKIIFTGPQYTTPINVTLETTDGQQLTSNKTINTQGSFAINNRNMLTESVSSTETYSYIKYVMVNGSLQSQYTTIPLRTLTVGESAHRVKIGGFQIEKSKDAIGLDGLPVSIGSVDLSGINTINGVSVSSLTGSSSYISSTTIANSGNITNIGNITNDGNITTNKLTITGLGYNSSKHNTNNGVSTALLTYTTTIFTGSSSSYTLANGGEGQYKTLISTSTGTTTIAVSSAGWRISNGAAAGTITLTGLGISCQLQYFTNYGWICIGNNGATFS